MPVVMMDSDGTVWASFTTCRCVSTAHFRGSWSRRRSVFTGNREAFADTVKVLRPAASRLRTPPCPNARFCDGCPMIAMQYPAQLAWKEALVKEEMTHFPSLAESAVHEILPSLLRSTTGIPPNLS